MIKSGKSGGIGGGGRRSNRGGMGSRYMSRIIIFGVIALLYGGYQYITTGEFKMPNRGNRHNTTQSSKQYKSPPNDPSSNTDGNMSDARVFADLQDDKLIYTKHAKCRMDCRTISKNEIQDILQNGKINHRKSKPNDSPCPSYAIEGDTDDGQEVRIVFAMCDNVTKVITAIDLENKYECYCK